MNVDRFVYVEKLAHVDRVVYHVRMPAKSKASLKPAPLPARDRILQTAHDLFYQEGIRATGIDRVIADAGVTKVTFYRHFPSKHQLVEAVLDVRHERWMAWFVDALQRHAVKKGAGLQAIVATLSEWFAQSDFRGCAFINTVVELGGSVPSFVSTSRDHKQAMTKAIMELMPPSDDRESNAAAVAMAIDGAIVRAQYAQRPEDALAPLSHLLRALEKSS